VKEKFRTHTGTPVEFQRLILRREGVDIRELNDNSKMLGFYSVESGMEIHIIDLDPFSLSRNGGLTDTSLIEKYKMSEEKYAARKGTLREFLKEKKEKEALNAKPSDDSVVYPGLESVVGIEVDMRCQVMPGRR
jgi:tubulin-folding cofactor B